MESGKAHSSHSSFYGSVISPVLSEPLQVQWPSSETLEGSEDGSRSYDFQSGVLEGSLASTVQPFLHLKNGDFSWSGAGSWTYEKGLNFPAIINPNHLWLIWFLSMIVFVFILLGCSLHNKFFQESFLLARAKQWVHLPVLNSAQDPLLSVEPGTVSYTVADCCPSTANWDASGLDDQHTELTWVSETDRGLGEKDLPRRSIKTESQPCLTSIDVVNTDESEKATFLENVTSETSKPEKEPMETQLISKDYSESGVCLSPLTKTGSLDETQIGSCRKEVREKRFKANRSVEEFLEGSNNLKAESNAIAAGTGGIGGSSSPGTPQGKCRAKLQERRGSSHSLTIAVKSAESILPTVTTPRECSATQFLLTAGNCMNRHQLRACLKDVKSLHAEFWSIPTNVPDPVDQASGSALKNRYRYVLPNPHSRVKLPCDSVDPDCCNGYINGNYIRAYDGKPAMYIATQGPLANTVNDFWLMVWNEKAPAVVMITRLVEGGRAKCESYLPNSEGANGFTQFGSISVRIDSVEEHDGYVLRRLTLKSDAGQSHCLSHYWYSDWPDHKTPDNPRTLVDMAIAVESLRRSGISGTHPGPFSLPPDSGGRLGPIVVHCSAGVGRTGCFIALCHGLSQLVTEGKVDVLGIVCALRCDRGGMVQTAEQYEFIHRGLCLFERTLAD